MKELLIRLTKSEPPLKLPGKHLKTRNSMHKKLSLMPRAQLRVSSMARLTRNYWRLRPHLTRRMQRQRKSIPT